MNTFSDPHLWHTFALFTGIDTVWVQLIKRAPQQLETTDITLTSAMA